MKIRLAAAAASTGLAVSALLAVAPAGAQPAPLPLTVDPTSGADGIFNVSGTGCFSPETGPGAIDLFIDGFPLVNDDPENPDIADDEGNWLITVEPEDPSVPLEPGVLEITATCSVNDGAEIPTVIVEYAPASYEIVAATPPETTPPAPEAPAPAEPVVVEPTFTG